MKLGTTVTRGLVTCAAVAALVPAAAYACDPGQNTNRSDAQNSGGQFFGHHHKVLLKGTVQSVDTNAGTVTVNVTDANRRTADLVGKTFTVKATKGWVADTNNDGSHSIADVQSGDTVIVFTKRRFVDTNTDTISAAFVFDKTNSPMKAAEHQRSWS